MEELLITYNNFSICLVSNDIETLNSIKMEFEDYYTFNKDKIDSITNKIMLVRNQYLYNKYISKEISNNEFLEKLVLKRERDTILLYDKRDKTITILYSDITEDVMQFIGEVILSIFGKNIEGDSYYFFHSACVSIDNNGIAIMGERNVGKTTLMCRFLQSGFEFVANSRIGIQYKNEVKVIGLPSRVGIRYDTVNKVFSKHEKEKFIQLKEEEYRRRRNKMNITVKEVKDVFQAKIVSGTKLKIVLIPVYIPNSSSIQIIKMDNREVIDVLLKSRKSGVYDSVKYIESFYQTDKVKFDFEDFKNIKFLKVIVNEENSKKLVELIKNGLENEEKY